MTTFWEAIDVYAASDGERTKALYDKLMTLGPRGLIALNLFRACKCSERAKVYRGRRYKADAYDRKHRSMNNLCKELSAHAESTGIVWGWKVDPTMSEDSPHRFVLYVEIPTGQISFHGPRGDGPDYAGEWDQATKSGPDRICQWIGQLFETVPA